MNNITIRDITLSSFSGYMALGGKLLDSSVPIVGRVFTVSDGIITAAFDKQGNPNKS